MAAGVAVSTFLLTATLAWSQPVPGSLDVHWNEGASDCSATPQEALQVHRYEPQTFILRQSPCADFEANFIYLLIGSDKALLIDTGAVVDPKAMPLAKTRQSGAGGSPRARARSDISGTSGHIA
jgi:hydroxyacylglutathione hydrolase